MKSASYINPESTTFAPRSLAEARVLVAEDNYINQRVITAMLARLGVSSYRIVENGEEAVRAALEELFDLVIMDCQMPVMDGYTATEQIRAQEASLSRTNPLRIVALTAHCMNGDRERCLAAGMNDYATKPIETNELRLVLERNLYAQ